MKKRRILFLLSCLILAISLFACSLNDDPPEDPEINGDGTEDACKDGHTYSEQWSYDWAKHWHAATCEHNLLKKDEATHEYIDGACICGARAHEHSYSNTWSYDEDSHWHTSTCGHDEKHAFAAHDYDGNYVCITCGYRHQHTLSTTWSFDDRGHWYAAECDHGVKGDLLAHEFGTDFVCDVCGYEHQHTFFSSWEMDYSSHWHASSCGHNVKGDAGAHEYVDGVCRCGAIKAHEHTYSDTWSYNSGSHWHAADCGHDVKSDISVHNYGADFLCVDCGYEHHHTYASKWSCNKDGHWHAADCGHDVKSDSSPHNFGADYVCDDCGYEPKHTYADGWSYDEDGHWRVADCGHGVTGDSLPHNFGADYVCDDCGYEHKHTYADGWSYDGDDHWHAADCGHDVKSDSSPHNFGTDFECDDCGYEHQHTSSGTMLYDESGHWYEADCGHTAERIEYAEHNYGDGNVCEACKFIKPIVIAKEDMSSGAWGYSAKKKYTQTKPQISTRNLLFVTAGTVIRYDPNGFKLFFDLPTTLTSGSATAAKDGSTRSGWYSEPGEYVVQRDTFLGITVCYPDELTTIKPSYFDSDIVIYPGTEKDGHRHTYASKWSYDESGHWCAANCNHDARYDESSHDYGTDYVCDVCGYEHQHTYASDWSYDDSSHWHAATCGHDVKGDLSEHFIGGDDACVGNCGYKYDAPHVHSYSTKWSKDEKNHWHASACGHEDEITGFGEHTYGDDDVCDVCDCIKPIVITKTDISSGGWGYSAKKKYTESKPRIGTRSLMFVKAGTVIRFDPKGFQIYLDLPTTTTSDSSTAAADGSTRSGWYTEPGEYVVQRDAYLGITIAYPDGTTTIKPSYYDCDIVIFPGTGEVERTYEKVNVYRFGGEGNDWCFVYLPEGYDPDRAEPYPFVIANHGNGWNMDGSLKKANWTDNTMYMSAAEIALQKENKKGRFIETEDSSLWYSNPTIEALLAAGYIVCGAQNYGDNLYGNDNCTDAVVDFFNHMVETYNVESACHMIGASNGAMTTLNAAEKLGDRVKSMIIQYPLASIITHYLAGGHRDNIEAAYGLDTSKTYTKAELEAVLAEYDPLYKNVVNGVKQGYYPAIKVYYSNTDTLTTAEANALPLIELLENSGKKVVGVQVDADGSNRQHGDGAHFDPQAYIEWFEENK